VNKIVLVHVSKLAIASLFETGRKRIEGGFTPEETASGVSLTNIEQIPGGDFQLSFLVGDPADPRTSTLGNVRTLSVWTQEELP